MADLDDATLPHALRPVLGAWGLAEERVVALGGGMNSATALVGPPGAPAYVAKWVPASRADDLRRGAATAERLAAGGIGTGPPRRTIDGALTLPLAAGEVALLDHVPGRPLTGEGEAEQHLMARTLASVHAAAPEVGAGGSFPTWWVEPRPHLPAALAAVVADLLAAVERTRLTWCDLHTDPAPEAFLDVGADHAAVIDWAGSTRGPALYDVASAVMYLGGRAEATSFLAEYTACAPIPAAELEAHLDLFWRVRGAVQAVYFCDRLEADDLTGIDDHGDNEQGRDHGLRMLGLGA